VAEAHGVQGVAQRPGSVQVTLMQRRGGQLRRQRRAGIVLANGGQGVELPVSHDMGVAGVPVGVQPVG
jgi:hypothetical protein